MYVITLLHRLLDNCFRRFGFQQFRIVAYIVILLFERAFVACCQSTISSCCSCLCLFLVPVLTDCINGTKSGVYKIKPHDAEEPFSVYCDMDMDGGGWAVSNLNTENTLTSQRRRPTRSRPHTLADGSSLLHIVI